jgi:hypothetical protein
MPACLFASFEIWLTREFFGGRQLTHPDEHIDGPHDITFFEDLVGCAHDPRVERILAVIRERGRLPRRVSADIFVILVAPTE